MLVLDGVIQCTEKDEFSYQEMIAFLPLCSHSNPKSVLIVGGGDGGVAREVSKFPGINEIDQIEIDEKVIEVSKKYLPFMANGLSNPKVNLFIGDGYEYLKNQTKKYDIIITDSSDPIGPAKALFEMSYFHLIKRALNSNGIICSQAGTIWANFEQVKTTFSHCKALFSKTNYGIAPVPTYPTGQIGFVLGSLNPMQSSSTIGITPRKRRKQSPSMPHNPQESFSQRQVQGRNFRDSTYRKRENLYL
ncbi:spermidine synthase isoform X2 [Phymastichus coffea]|nr:spermidine synthase isoform X2 [Phymastichus coffea]XP_058805112.1 spermidine synthase isoform X2 [Phymastichus coffea]